jgi:hypothetical protein
VTAILKPRVKVGAEWVNKGQNLEQVIWAPIILIEIELKIKVKITKGNNGSAPPKQV